MGVPVFDQPLQVGRFPDSHRLLTIKVFLVGSSRVSSASVWKVSWSGFFGVSSVCGVRKGVSISTKGYSNSSKKHLFVHVQIWAYSF